MATKKKNSSLFPDAVIVLSNDAAVLARKMVLNLIQLESQNCVSKRARFRVGDGWCNSQASKKAIEVVIEVINRGEVLIDIQREQFTDVMLIR